MHKEHLEIRPEKYAVLVVDDIEANRDLLTRRLEKSGHEVWTASDGGEALSMVRERSFDLILLDIMMPRVDGYQVLEQLKADEVLRHIPVIMITALGEMDSVVRCIELGAEDYLPKPFNPVLLQARINACLEKKRAHDLKEHYQRHIEGHNHLLEELVQKQAEENQLVAQLMERMMQSSGLRDPALRYWLNPSDLVSGDLVAAARNGNGKLFVMLADSTGHGLPAALNLLPINRIFYRMVEKGFPVTTIVEEMNRALKQQSPANRFVAAVVASVDFPNRTVEIWNGGIPTALFCNDRGEVMETFPSCAVPLGILGEDFACHTRVWQWPEGGQLLFFSDGLVEAEDPGGTPFGEDGVRATMAGTEHRERFGKLVAAVHSHLGNRHAHDDVSLLTVDCQVDILS